MTHIKNNLSHVQQQIQLACNKANRDHHSVNLLAVSKTKPCVAIEEAYLAGQRAFGENYLQESVEKIAQLAHLSEASWHFIGPIQSNKTKLIAENFSWVHTIDRAKIAIRLNEHRSDQDTPLNVCLQVNISSEDSKSGVSKDEVLALAQIINDCKNLTLRGLMAIPEKQAPQSTYEEMNALCDLLKAHYPSVDTLSMGMSNDLEVAIKSGATIVRIGSAIFGARA